MMNLQNQIEEMQKVALDTNVSLQDVIAMRQTLYLEEFLRGFEKVQAALTQAVYQEQL